MTQKEINEWRVEHNYKYASTCENCGHSKTHKGLANCWLACNLTEGRVSELFVCKEWS
ncbi:MAG: hypothetical protein Ta2B_09400 [Termitinemataceae bacterium]|nr:MAG: hypothetical protein Ta2B_09400 [Termitinemataceae bacterium]